MFSPTALQLTITDLIAEVHDTHHPIAADLYYEDQKKEAKARSAAFLSERAPSISAISSACWPIIQLEKRTPSATSSTTVDLSLFQVWAGLAYAFPRAFAGADKLYPALAALAAKVAAQPNVAAYLASERRIPFNESGVFRHYPELDQAAEKAGRRKS